MRRRTIPNTAPGHLWTSKCLTMSSNISQGVWQQVLGFHGTLPLWTLSFVKYHLSIGISEFLHHILCQITLESNLPIGDITRNICAFLPISHTNREGCTNKRERALTQVENWVAMSNFLKPNTMWVLLLTTAELIRQLHPAAILISGKPRKILRNSQTICTLRIESEAFWPHTLLLYFKAVLWILLQWFQNAGEKIPTYSWLEANCFKIILIVEKNLLNCWQIETIF